MGDNKNVKPFQLALEASKIMYVDNLKLDKLITYVSFISNRLKINVRN